MNSKFMDLLNRLFNRIEKDAEKNEMAIEALERSLHKNELDIKKIGLLPKKICTTRFEKVETRLTTVAEKMIWVSGICVATMFIFSGLFGLGKHFKWF